IAKAYVSALRDLLRALDVSDVKMEQGSMRCDVNLSLMPKGSNTFGTRSETKNVNSLRSVERAVRYEIQRHAAVLQSGGAVTQETRHWHEDTGITTAGREKSDAEDYRYFPEPDLPPLEISREQVADIADSMPELPRVRRARFESAFGLSAQDSAVITDESIVADYYERAVTAAGGHHRDVANWLTGDVFALARSRGGFSEVKLSPEHLADIVVMVRSGEINAQAGKDVLGLADESGTSPRAIVEERGLRQESDVDLVASAVAEALAVNPSAVADFRAGKQAAIGFLIGQVMRTMKGRGNPAVVRQELTRQLGESA
ncbi:MAG: Asp-tRNA(Asn)/Glu-tRNA(Gln) amidotransferase GatCAB subunit B, partial [Thermomicrobiales bacterium]|nr:Asp-tRNA(Asn)/Glu-tRNA(Gln) amidotransferase GatCAB subunit B [Thermomicrobiales bacterium]